MWFRSEPPEYPERKQQRLKCFNYASGAAYFVTICTHQRACLFGEIMSGDLVGADLCVRPNADQPHLNPAFGEPHKMIVKWIEELEQKYSKIAVDAYIVMPDHIHLILLQSALGADTGAALQEILKWLKTQTTNEYIRGVKAGIYRPFEKRVWQRGYYEHIIRNEHDLMETRRYIESNPARWIEKQRGNAACAQRADT